MRRLTAHSDLVTDLVFSPFDDGLLATGSADQTIKIWRIPSGGLEDDLSRPVVELPDQPRRVERLRWHPTTSCLLGSGSGDQVRLWDLLEEQSVLGSLQHGDTVQQAALLAYLKQGEEAQPYLEAVLAARLAGTVYKTLSKDDQYEAARNETILSIAKWVKEHPRATQVGVDDESVGG